MFDPTFACDGGVSRFDDIVTACAITPYDQIIVGGKFSCYNRAAANKLAYLDTEGNLLQSLIVSDGNVLISPTPPSVVAPYQSNMYKLWLDTAVEPPTLMVFDTTITPAPGAWVDALDGSRRLPAPQFITQPLGQTADVTSLTVSVPSFPNIVDHYLPGTSTLNPVLTTDPTAIFIQYQIGLNGELTDYDPSVGINSGISNPGTYTVYATAQSIYPTSTTDAAPIWLPSPETSITFSVQPKTNTPYVVNNSSSYGVTNIHLTASGASYTIPPLVTIGGSGTATATTTLNSSGGVATITVVNAGTGYTSTPPTITITNAPGDTTGNGATATCTTTILTSVFSMEQYFSLSVGCNAIGSGANLTIWYYVCPQGLTPPSDITTWATDTSAGYGGTSTSLNTGNITVSLASIYTNSVVYVQAQQTGYRTSNQISQAVSVSLASPAITYNGPAPGGGLLPYGIHIANPSGQTSANYGMLYSLTNDAPTIANYNSGNANVILVQNTLLDLDPRLLTVNAQNQIIVQATSVYYTVSGSTVTLSQQSAISEQAFACAEAPAFITSASTVPVSNGVVTIIDTNQSDIDITSNVTSAQLTQAPYEQVVCWSTALTSHTTESTAVNCVASSDNGLTAQISSVAVSSGHITGVTISPSNLGTEYPPNVIVGAAGSNDCYYVPVRFAGGSGSGATAYGLTLGGQLTSVIVTNGGSGYSGTPTATVDAPNAVYQRFSTGIAEFGAGPFLTSGLAGSLSYQYLDTGLSAAQIMSSGSLQVYARTYQTTATTPPILPSPLSNITVYLTSAPPTIKTVYAFYDGFGNLTGNTSTGFIYGFCILPENNGDKIAYNLNTPYSNNTRISGGDPTVSGSAAYNYTTTSSYGSSDFVDLVAGTCTTPTGYVLPVIPIESLNVSTNVTSTNVFVTEYVLAANPNTDTFANISYPVYQIPDPFAGLKDAVDSTLGRPVYLVEGQTSNILTYDTNTSNPGLIELFMDQNGTRFSDANAICKIVYNNSSAIVSTTVADAKISSSSSDIYFTPSLLAVNNPGSTGITINLRFFRAGYAASRQVTVAVMMALPPVVFAPAANIVGGIDVGYNFPAPGGSGSPLAGLAGLVTLTCSLPTADIYFTLDGSVPGLDNELYYQPFFIRGPATVIAIAKKFGWADSPITSAKYT